jgi:starch synthase (maltosyl-transferring)
VPEPTRTAAAPTRLVIEDVTPAVAGGRYPVKRVVGEPVTVGATAIADGHDLLRVVVSHRPPGSRRWIEVPMTSVNPGLDRWEGTFVPDVEGLHRYRVRAWIDRRATWRDALARKVEAGVDEPVDHEGEPSARFTSDDAATSVELTALVESERALFSTWYELFPRSVTPRQKAASGTLADVTAQLDTFADLAIDILYLPPIHPIGTTFRKGTDNAPVAAPGDPGSPWAIGSAEGGHTAVHPDLGTIADFDALVKGANARGIEVALDLAFQCSPDHPWVAEHPEWFARRPDGTIQYAENPPKRYQDIYPLNFETPAWRELWDALLEVTLFWAAHGVSTFRVDNPHTKPFAFWEWLIEEVQARHPGAMFLSEAFTRPPTMHHLARLGFTQSYCYFPWRVTRDELIEYFVELSSGPSVDELRPSAWPNTPDILPWHLQHASLATFALRLVLAATLSPSYGVYGPAFELGENEPAGNGKEEYGRSEKYEVRDWSWDGHDLRRLLAEINVIRRDHLAFHTLRTLRFHGADNEALLCFSKTPHAGPSVEPSQPAAASMLVVVNLDPDAVQGGTLSLDLGALGIDPTRGYVAEDLLGGCSFDWWGDRPFVLLDPRRQPAHVLRLVQVPADESTDPTAVEGRG